MIHMAPAAFYNKILMFLCYEKRIHSKKTKQSQNIYGLTNIVTNLVGVTLIRTKKVLEPTNDWPSFPKTGCCVRR
jgi:hypothetical protein